LKTQSTALRIRASDCGLATLVVVLVALRIANETTANVSYFAIAAYALLGRAQAIQALALSWLFSMISPGIAAESSGASLGRYAVIAAAATSVVLRSRRVGESVRVSRITAATVVLGGVLVGHSFIFSPIADVSILKALLWTVVTATLLAAWGGLHEGERTRVSSQIFGGLVTVMLLSLPLLAMPLGFLRNGTGFQGILNQPQGFGATMALLGAWTGARMLGQERPPLPLILLAAVSMALVILSEARTAGLGLLLGLGLAVLTVPWLSRRRVAAVLPGLKSRRMYLVVGAIVLGVVSAGSVLTDRIGLYFEKRGEDFTSLADAYQTSRGGLIDAMTENIALHPFTGIGFGVASEPEEMIVEREPLFGLPTSAAIEKGVLPIAVVEELGAFGAAAVLAWFCMVVGRARSNVTSLALVLTTLVLNLGESTFFSPGGLGLLPLILLGWAATAKPGRVAV
jgi:hypothetical protein